MQFVNSEAAVREQFANLNLTLEQRRDFEESVQQIARHVGHDSEEMRNFQIRLMQQYIKNC